MGWVRLIGIAAVMTSVIGCGGEDEAPSEAALRGQLGHLLHKRGHSSATGGDPTLHGGATLPLGKTYALYWGSPTGFPNDAVSGIENLLEGFTGSSFSSIAAEYMASGAAPDLRFGATLRDPSVPPKRPLTVTQVASEVCSILHAHALRPEADAVYFLYTDNAPPGMDYCAWHAHGECDGADIAVVYVPNPSGVEGCDPGDLYGCNDASQGTRALANLTSGELMAAITDSRLNGWYDAAGQEIGDKCAWRYSSCVALATGAWQLQEEWSAEAGACVQQ